MASLSYSVLPVVDDDLKLVGVISKVDAGSTPRRPSTYPRRVRATTVGEVMTERVVTSEPREDVGALVRRMRAAQIRVVPVLNEGLVVGVVGLRDLDEVVARIDERIATELRRRLDLCVRPGQFTVQVRDGEVVLVDSLDDRTQWHTIQVLAEQVSDVRHVRVVGTEAASTHPRPSTPRKTCCLQQFARPSKRSEPPPDLSSPGTGR